MTRSHFVRRLDRGAVPTADARWFLFVNDKLLVLKRGDAYLLPDGTSLTALGLEPMRVHLLGDLDGAPCFVGALPDEALPEYTELIDLRRAYAVLPEAEYAVAGYAEQIAQWDRTSRFCPVCATSTEQIPHEWSKRCPRCGFMQYPRISPAIIVLVYRPGQILLSRQPQWPPNRYSLIAGFVEAGESLEACLQREVAEETGVSVDSIRYLGSQPWPFPHQLMVGFLARYHSGELIVDRNELEHAAWFDLDALPDLPPRQSIARRILDWYLAAQPELDSPFPTDPFSV